MGTPPPPPPPPLEQARSGVKKAKKPRIYTKNSCFDSFFLFCFFMVRVIVGRIIWISDLKGKQKLLRVSRRFELSRVRVTEGTHVTVVYAHFYALCLFPQMFPLVSSSWQMFSLVSWYVTVLFTRLLRPIWRRIRVLQQNPAKKKELSDVA